MFQSQTSPADARPDAVAFASDQARATFIWRTYLHLALAIFAFVFLEIGLFLTGIAHVLVPMMMGRASWMIVLMLFMGVSWLADRWARNATSTPMQYAGLGLYVLVQAVIFLPLIAIALTYAPEAIPSAALVTLLVFGGLTAVVFITRKDFSFMRSFLAVASLVALGTIVAALIFGFELGVFFSGAMCLLAAGYILYNTSNILHHYRTDQYVSAALGLFASVALLFWYILRIFIDRR